MKVLVIGASGLLAKPVVKHLDQNGFQIRLFSRSINKSMYSGNFEIAQGDVLNKIDLEKAIAGCDAVHITIAGIDEFNGVKNIVEIAKQNKIKLISYVSGASVKKENTWFSMIENKFKAEKLIENSGIPYIILRPTWFMESLELMVRNGKASIIGKQNNPVSMLAADDFSRMIVNAYKNKETYHKTYYIYGPKQYLLKDALEKYCNAVHPKIKKVSIVPAGLLKFIGFISGNKVLRDVAAMFSYFEKVGEDGSSEEANQLLGKPAITFEMWLKEIKK